MAKLFLLISILSVTTGLVFGNSDVTTEPVIDTGCSCNRTGCIDVKPSDRVECGWEGITKSECEKKGCCFDDSIQNIHWCFVELSDTPTDMPTDTPTDMPTDTQTDMTTDTSTDTPTDTLTDIPTDMPTDTPTDTPTDMPTGMPSDRPTDMPTGTPTDTPTDTSTDTQTDMPTDTPTDTPKPDSVCYCIDPISGTNYNHCDYPHGFRYCGVYPNSTCDDLLCLDFESCTSVFACPSELQPSDYPKCDTESDQACQCMDTKQCEGDDQCNLCNEINPFQVCRIDPNSNCQDKYCSRIRGEPDRCLSVAACGCST